MYARMDIHRSALYELPPPPILCNIYEGKNDIFRSTHIFIFFLRRFEDGRPKNNVYVVYTNRKLKNPVSDTYESRGQ